MDNLESFLYSLVKIQSAVSEKKGQSQQLTTSMVCIGDLKGTQCICLTTPRFFQSNNSLSLSVLFLWMILCLLDKHEKSNMY